MEKGKGDARANYFRSRKGDTDNFEEPREPTEGNEELRRLDVPSEPGPPNKRARAAEKVDVADKVGIAFARSGWFTELHPLAARGLLWKADCRDERSKEIVDVEKDSGRFSHCVQVP